MGFIFTGSKIFMDSFRVIREESYFKIMKTQIDVLVEKSFNGYFNYLVEKFVFSPEGNLILKSFKKSRYAKKIRKKFSFFDVMHRTSIKYPRENDYVERQGDLIILKKTNLQNNEKGVIYICYTEALGRFAALYDIEKLAIEYQFVFEPSWWGYQNAFFLLFHGLDTEVVIECPYFKDYDFIKKLNRNFHASHLGFGDWVDDENFTTKNNRKKIFDIVMVGNWSKVKRHEVLFRAVSLMRFKPKIALIGYPAFDRTKEDVWKEAIKHKVNDLCVFFENIPPREVAEVLSKSKINVLLSIGEGANRGIYEGMFCGNVVVVYRFNKGVNLSNINDKTGYLATDEELPDVLETAIRNYENFDTRKWALENTGYRVATKILNTHLKKIALDRGYEWNHDIVCKKNLPNAVYASEKYRLILQKEYKRISNYLIND